MQGIENLGSTCAINSLIQIITRNDILRNIILNNNFAANTISEQLKEIINLMYVQNNSIIPRKFLSTFFTIFKDIFYSGEQIDIGELWTFLSDKISEELKEIAEIAEIDTVSASLHSDRLELKDYLTQGVVYKDDQEFHNAIVNCKLLKKKYEYYYNKFNKKPTMWLKSTQGFYLNTTRCLHCNLTFYNFEPFTSLNIDIPNDIKHPKISDLISKSLKEEVIQGDWFCSKCSKNTSYKKSTKLWKLPDVLVIIIKRFINIHLKNDEAITINDYLNFNKGSVISNRKDVVYTFSSVALHFGSLNGGHYSAICNTPDGDILYDDRNVIRIDLENSAKINFKDKNSNAYMLVYTKKKDSK
jgi:ubiquitin C-terminal hydrolase